MAGSGEGGFRQNLETGNRNGTRRIGCIRQGMKLPDTSYAFFVCGTERNMAPKAAPPRHGE